MIPINIHTPKKIKMIHVNLDSLLRAYVDVCKRRIARTLPLTKPMIFAMTAVEARGPEAWCDGGGRADGAISRMWDTLVERGLAVGPPYKITAAGRAALKAVPIKHQRVTPASLQRINNARHNRSRG